MNPHEITCQLPCLQHVSEGVADVPPQSLSRRVKLMIRRRLEPRSERRLKMFSNDLANWLCRITGRNGRPAAHPVVAERPLQGGDWIRVRSRTEIDATLNHWRQLKGCTFMPEMDQYCGTTQRVLTRVERFVDERDLRVKTTRGIILLEGVICQGTADFGRCDRCCFPFWREEWLEKIATEGNPGPSVGTELPLS